MDYDFDKIEENQSVSQKYQITADVHQTVLDTFGDRSPVHSDEAYARRHGFDGLVIHGATLNGYISNFLGMHFPGGKFMCQSVNAQYKAPVFINDEIQITGVVTQKVDALGVLILELEINNLTRNNLAATARAQAGLTESP